MKIRYQNPNDINSFLYEELDSNIPNKDEYIRKLHRNELCDHQTSCNGENCKIYVDIGSGNYVLAGVED